MVAVNVSAVEFWRRDFLDGVQTILQETGLGARHLDLELTEDLLMQDAMSAASALRALKGMGVHVVVDHFGTGHSGLNDLRQLPIDVLKIDQSFVHEIASDSNGASFVTAIVDLGKNLNHRVIAAGVETRSQLAFLRAQHCQEGQGYLFGPPIVGAQFGEQLRTGLPTSLPH